VQILFAKPGHVQSLEGDQARSGVDSRGLDPRAR
jgi:hypothetical protein